MDAPFLISEQCCDELKKKPMKEFQKRTGKVPFVATMATEGQLRQQRYLQTGCNAYYLGKSQPLGFWTDQDVLKYIKENNLEICSVYGDIIENENSKLELTGERRTGCIFCTFGCHLEKSPNRFQRLKVTHPKQYDYCMNKLGLDEVLNYIGVDH